MRDRRDNREGRNEKHMQSPGEAHLQSRDEDKRGERTGVR